MKLIFIKNILKFNKNIHKEIFRYLANNIMQYTNNQAIKKAAWVRLNIMKQPRVYTYFCEIKKEKGRLCNL